MEPLTLEELALTLRVLRERRTFLEHLIEMQKSQRRRGLPDAPAEINRLQAELATLSSAIRKFWGGSE